MEDPRLDLLPSLFLKINENQLTLEAAIMELTKRVERLDVAEVADNVRGALVAIDRKEEFIKVTLTVMMTRDTLTAGSIFKHKFTTQTTIIKNPRSQTKKST